MLLLRQLLLDLPHKMLLFRHQKTVSTFCSKTVPWIADVSKLCSHTVPETPPLEFTVQAMDSRTLLLSWEPPNAEDRNGIIRQYNINVTEMETGTLLQLVTDNTAITAFPQHPNYIYSCTVAAKTSIGLGPYTFPRVIQMPEDGK